MPVGNVDAMRIKSVDALGTESVSTITSKNVQVNPNATYGQVDTFARALYALSNNTYQDTILVTLISVNEKLADE